MKKQVKQRAEMEISLTLTVGGYVKRSELKKIIQLIPKNQAKSKDYVDNNIAINAINQFIKTGKVRQNELILKITFQLNYAYEYIRLRKILLEEKMDALIEKSDNSIDRSRTIICSRRERYINETVVAFTCLKEYIVLTQYDLKKIYENSTMQELKENVEKFYLPVSPIKIEETARKSIAWIQKKIKESRNKRIQKNT